MVIVSAMPSHSMESLANVFIEGFDAGLLRAAVADGAK